MADEMERPYPNEHACRLQPPSNFQPNSFRRIERKHDGKTYSVIIGKLKGETATTEQAYRYAKDTWSAGDARKHCQAHDGTFEAAAREHDEIVEEVIPELDRTICERVIFDGVELRGVDEDKRIATFVAATEEPVETWSGPEYLRMSGLKLNRYRKNPVVLDTHNRLQAEAVIGKADVSHENGTLVADITFAGTDRANQVWELVRGGFLKALSVGFLPRKVRRLEEGDTAKLGDREVNGPARIITEWELYEISIVPVPADQDAIRRGFFNEIEPDLFEKLLSRCSTADNALTDMRDIDMSTRVTKATKPTEDTTSAESVTTEDEQLVSDRKRPQGNNDPPDEVLDRSCINRAIFDMTPDGLRHIAERCIIEGLSIEQSRKRLLKAHVEQCSPVGTPEPAEIEQVDIEAKSAVEQVDEDLLLRSLTSV